MRLGIILLLIISLVAVAGCGPEDKWVKDLKNSDPDVRINAVKQLTELGTQRALTELTVFQSTEKDFRVQEAIRDGIKTLSGRTFMK